MVEVNQRAAQGIANAQFMSMHELSDLIQHVLFTNAQPISEALNSYEPASEFVASIIETTRTLPGPQIWFEIFPRLLAAEE